MTAAPGYDAPTIFFDDLEPGRVFELGSYRLTEDEVVTFSQTWAPHPSHVDPAWAAAGFFGGLVAPVSLSYAACARLVTVELLPHLAFAAGRDVLLQPKAPVRPGEEIHVRVEVTGLAEARRPGHGDVTFTCACTRADGTAVLVVRMELLVARRPTG